MGTPEDVAAERYFTPPERGMTIDEAIRILKIIKEDCDRLNEPYSKEAVSLAIKALEVVKRAHIYLEGYDLGS